jgi:hypothetical protein
MGVTGASPLLPFFAFPEVRLFKSLRSRAPEPCATSTMAARSCSDIVLRRQITTSDEADGLFAAGRSQEETNWIIAIKNKSALQQYI